MLFLPLKTNDTSRLMICLLSLLFMDSSTIK